MKKLARLSLIIVFLGLFYFTLQAIPAKAETSLSYNSQLASLWETFSQINKLFEQLKALIAKNPRISSQSQLAAIGATDASTIFSNTFAPDLRNFGSGWSSAHWIPTINRLWTFGGDSHNSAGNNSVRLFDPVANMWTTAVPNTWGSSGCKNSDNYHSFYVPSTDEVWVLAGQGATSQFLCRYGVQTRTWVGLYQTKTDAAAYIDGIDAWVHAENAAVAYSGARDQALFLGGASNGSPSAILRRIIKNSVDSAKPFRYVQNPWFTGVPPTANARNRMVAVGGSFYVLLGQRLFVSDGATATELAPAPVGGSLSYNSTRNLLVLFGPSGIAAYDLIAQTWTNTPVPAGQITFANTMGDYSPAVDYSLYTGGYAYRDGVQLTDTTTPTGYQAQFQVVGVRTASSSSPPPPPPSTYLLTITASGLGTGTVTGAGSYIAGASVTLAGVPATGSTFSGWSGPTGCPQTTTSLATIVMPAGALTCTTTFVLVAPPPPPPMEGIIDIPVNTWIRKLLPGGGASLTSGKHMRFTFNPVDGRIYQVGGDFYGMSSWPEMYSYGVFDNSWRKEQSMCVTPPDVQHGGADEVTWTYDTKRNIFWMIPGYMHTGTIATRCPTGTLAPMDKIMTWDPATKKWSVPPRQSLTQFGAISAFHKYGHYDPVTDTIVLMDDSAALSYNITANTWTRYWWTFTDRRTVRVSQEYSVIDLVGRAIYVIDGAASRLYRWGLDSHVMTDLGLTNPSAVAFGGGNTRLSFDSNNRVILWPQSDTNNISVYHVDTGKWEMKVANNSSGMMPEPSSQTFDPRQNVLFAVDFGLAAGVTGREYLWLYRYGAGSVSPPPPLSDSTPPSTPANLTATAVSSSQINLSWSASTDNVGVTGYRIYRSGIQIATVTTNSYQNTGLTASTLYSYTIAAYDAAGNTSGQSTAVSATTLSASDTIAPTVSIAAPLAGATVSGSSVTISANATDNVGVAGVQFKLDGTNLGAEDTASPYSISWNTTSVPNSSHTLTAVARDAAGNQGTSGSVSVTTSNSGVITPTVTLSAYPATISSGGSATLNWSSANATSCTASGGWSGTKAISGSQSTGALTTTKMFTLSCTGSGGTVSQSVTVTVNLLNDTTPLSAISDLHATSRRTRTISFEWSLPFDNSGKAASYEIRYLENDSDIKTKWLTANIISNSINPQNPGQKEFLVLGNLKPATNYTLAIRSRDIAGNVSDFSNVLTVRTKAIPPKPKLITVQFGSVILSWSADPYADGSLIYRVMRSDSPLVSAIDTSAILVATTTQTTITDSNVIPNRTYYYGIVSYADEGEYSPMETITVTTPVDPIPSPPDSGSGGGGGGGSYIVTPPVNPLVAYVSPNTPTTPIIIQSSQNISTQTPVSNIAVQISLPLYFGLKHPEVQIFQEFLIKQGFLNIQKTTDYFGFLTRSAVGKFQEKYGIAYSGGSGYGLVGPKTRQKIAELNNATTITDTNKQALIEKLKLQIRVLQLQLQILLQQQGR